MLRAVLYALVLMLPHTGWAQGLIPPSVFQQPPAAAPAAPATEPNLWDNGVGKSYLVPGLEIIGFDILLNRINNHHYGCCDYAVTMDSIRRNLHSGWVTDNDPFKVNQLGHPYQGSMYHGFARSAGLSYWESLGYTFAGSLAWEIAGRRPPLPGTTRSRAASAERSSARPCSGCRAWCWRMPTARRASGVKSQPP
jgi:hypothetical protein